jgi:hypothetical protein
MPRALMKAGEPGKKGKKKEKELMLLRDFAYACAAFLLLWTKTPASICAVCLALASTVCDESEYYRAYDTFLRAIQELRR